MPAPVIRAALFAAAFALPAFAEEKPSPLRDSPSWEAIRSDVVGDAPIADGSTLYTLEAPFRAQDAAAVPVRIVQAPGAPDVRKLTLVIDENPAPVAAEIEIGPAMAPLDLEMRVRVDAYSNLRAVVETADGARYMIGRFVRASGGCSAPGVTDAATAMATLGQMKVRWLGETDDGRREAQVMLRHPNYTGMQRNQLTLLFIPADFVNALEVREGEDLLFRVLGGISISEDPNFRFRYRASGAALEVKADDTEGRSFAGSFPVGS